MVTKTVDLLMSEDDRGRGILSNADREWLKKQTDGSTPGSSRQADSKRRHAIRNRIPNAIRDFELLAEELPQSLHQDVLEEIQNDSGSLTENFSHAFSFFYILLNEQQYMADAIAENDVYGAQHLLTFRDALRSGISSAKQQTPQFSSPPETILLDSNTSLGEVPPTETFEKNDILPKYEEFSYFRNIETGRQLIESGKFSPNGAKGLAIGDATSAVLTLLAERRANCSEKVIRPQDEVEL